MSSGKKIYVKHIIHRVLGPIGKNQRNQKYSTIRTHYFISVLTKCISKSCIVFDIYCTNNTIAKLQQQQKIETFDDTHLVELLFSVWSNDCEMF